MARTYFNTLNSFRLFGLKRKSVIFCLIEDFFELHGRATERKKDRLERIKITRWVILANGPAGARTKKGYFLAN